MLACAIGLMFGLCLGPCLVTRRRCWLGRSSKLRLMSRLCISSRRACGIGLGYGFGLGDGLLCRRCTMIDGLLGVSCSYVCNVLVIYYDRWCCKLVDQTHAAIYVALGVHGHGRWRLGFGIYYEQRL